VKRIVLISVITILVLVFPLHGYSVKPPSGPRMTDYCSAPPFLTQAVEPNIMIVIDMSGSMQFPAYGSITSYYYSNDVLQCTTTGTYDGTKYYYGYFKADKFYQYGSSKFEENGDCTEAQMNDPSSWDSTHIPGNLLNWATMSRVDVMRKVLIGGKSLSPQDSNVHTLLSEGATWAFTDASLGCTFSVSGGTNQAHELTITNNGTCPFTLAAASVKLDVPKTEKIGVVQEISDRDQNGDWDDDAPRFGLMIFGSDEGRILTGIAGSNASSFLTALQNELPYGGTPTGEAIANALIYYEQDAAADAANYYSNSAYVKQPGHAMDPWEAECQLSFILLISDGEWNGSLDPVVPAREGRLGIHGGRTGDLRNSSDPDELADDQWVTTYAVYAFSDSAAGRNALQQTAMYGGFTDKDANTWPYAYTGYPADSKSASLPQTNCNPGGTYNNLCYEWEIDHNGIPDNYYEATEGNQLKDKITEAIYDMLRRSSSGTSVSVLSTSAEGEGSLFQAFFNYEVVEGVRSVYWVGYLNGLWIDQYGNIREDTTQDQSLVLTEDDVIEFFVDTDGLTKIKKYVDSDGDCEVYPDDPDDSGNPPVTYALDYLKPIWEGGEKLALMSASSRTIYTYIDDGDGVLESGEWGDDKFDLNDATDASTLRPYLNAADNTEAQNIINFIRGEHVPTLRDRRLTVNGTPNQVWKLGDIVYSTPVIVGPPMMKFHTIYGDSTYHEYYRDYKDRRMAVYVGANDGMLHAFNAGFYHEGDNPNTSSKTERGWYSDPAGNNQIGKELWAYIPYNLLPHLKWLTDYDYCHVYYADLKPKVVDARIFTPSNDPDTPHSYGWGTILIGGMRLGGGEITCNGRTFRSAYFAIDVTDPLNPELLWEFTDADLGFTTSYPNVIRVGPRDQVGNWYAIFGSGVASYDGEGAATNRYVYILDLKTGALVRKIDMADAVGEDDIDGEDVFLGDPISIDLHVDYQVDSAYIGATYCDLNSCDADDWKGKMFRIDVDENTNVNQWTYSTMMSLDRPVTSAPTAAVDMFNRVWLYFGTGRYFSQDDREDLTTTQTLYGVWDPGSGTIDPSADLNDVTNVHVYEDGYVDVNGDGNYDVNDTTFKLYLSDRRNEYNSGTKHGWYVTLTGGERSLHKSTILGGVVLFPTFQPAADVCSYGGTSYLHTPYYETGTSYEESVVGLGANTITIDSSPYQELLRKVTLGSGMPTNAVIHSGQEEGVVSLIQLGTGVIIQLRVIPALSIKSQTMFWEERR
jgi:type IV pilus assembly protein PilY1